MLICIENTRTVRLPQILADNGESNKNEGLIFRFISVVAITLGCAE